MSASPRIVGGSERIAEAFASARANGRTAALMPYMMGGFPELQTSLEVGLAYADAGADLVELGVPFSDPLADGPVIHAAGTAALKAGITLHTVLELAQTLTRHIPVVLMCYSNLIVAKGLERFADQLVSTSVSGLIVPDLPLEESSEVRAVCDEREIALVPLVAPTTSPERMAQIGSLARGFLYLVSLLGTTGERSSLEERLPSLIAQAASHASVPVAVGFGIGTPEQAKAAASAGADGIIIGSRLVRAAGEGEGAVESVRALVREFSSALVG